MVASMTSKRDAIIEEFFQGDDLGFIIGTFDGVLSGTFDTVPETWEIMTGEYREGFLYGKLQLVMDNPLLFSRITTCGAALAFPEVVGTTDLMRGVPIDEDEAIMEEFNGDW